MTEKRRLRPDEKNTLLESIVVSKLSLGELAKKIGAVPGETTMRMWFQHATRMPSRWHAERVLQGIKQLSP